jgi:hypothetical protein
MHIKNDLVLHTTDTSQESLPASVHGLGIAVFNFACTLTGEIAPALLGALDPGTAPDRGW